jgi:hypothetical protein
MMESLRGMHLLLIDHNTVFSPFSKFAATSDIIP